MRSGRPVHPTRAPEGQTERHDARLPSADRGPPMPQGRYRALVIVAVVVVACVALVRRACAPPTRGDEDPVTVHRPARRRGAPGPRGAATRWSSSPRSGIDLAPGYEGTLRRQRRRDPRPTSSASCPSRTRCSSSRARARSSSELHAGPNCAMAIVWKVVGRPRHGRRPAVPRGASRRPELHARQPAAASASGAPARSRPSAASSSTGTPFSLRLVELGAGLGAGDQRGRLGRHAAAHLGARAPRAAP